MELIPNNCQSLQGTPDALSLLSRQTLIITYHHSNIISHRSGIDLRVSALLELPHYRQEDKYTSTEIVDIRYNIE